MDVSVLWPSSFILHPFSFSCPLSLAVARRSRMIEN
jgi:hypothetical protein